MSKHLAPYTTENASSDDAKNEKNLHGKKCIAIRARLGNPNGGPRVRVLRKGTSSARAAQQTTRKEFSNQRAFSLLFRSKSFFLARGVGRKVWATGYFPRLAQAGRVWSSRKSAVSPPAGSQSADHVRRRRGPISQRDVSA